MQVQKINFNYSSFNRKQNVNFKANEDKQKTPQYTKADIDQTTDLDKLYDMINFFYKTQINLDTKLENMEKRCEIAQREYNFAKSKLHNLEKEKSKLEIKRYENEKLFDLVGKKFSCLLTKFD